MSNAYLEKMKKNQEEQEKKLLAKIIPKPKFKVHDIIFFGDKDDSDQPLKRGRIRGYSITMRTWWNDFKVDYYVDDWSSDHGDNSSNIWIKESDIIGTNKTKAKEFLDGAVRSQKKELESQYKNVFGEDITW